jgi:hypothetical protein
LIQTCYDWYPSVSYKSQLEKPVYTATPGKELILYRQLGHPRLGEILALPFTGGQQIEDEETLKMKKNQAQPEIS